MRRSLVRLGGLLMLALLCVTLLALFSVWSLDRSHARAEQRLTDYWEAVEQGRQSQIHFKGQVHAWKNLLLRGADPARRAEYLAELERDEARVVAALDRGERRLGRIGLDAAPLEERVRALRAEHRRVGDGYREALALEGERAGDPRWDPSRIDARVLGLDRTFSRDLDALIDEAARQLDTLLSQQSAAARARYRTLRWAMWIATGCALVLVGGLLWRVLRERAGE
jgi:methyl-accepting chemotaxis protein